MVKPEGTTVSLQKRDDNHEPNALSHFQLVHTKMPFPKKDAKIDYGRNFIFFSIENIFKSQQQLNKYSKDS